MLVTFSVASREDISLVLIAGADREGTVGARVGVRRRTPGIQCIPVKRHRMPLVTMFVVN